MRGQVPRSCRGPISIPRRGCPQRALPQPGRAACAPVTATPSDAVAAARPADHTVAPTMSAGSERPRTSHGMTTAAAAHRGTRISAPEVTSGRTTSLAVMLAAPSKCGAVRQPGRSPSSRLWPEQRLGEQQPPRAAGGDRRRAPRRCARCRPARGRRRRARRSRAAARAPAPTRRSRRRGSAAAGARRRGRRSARRRRAATCRTSSRSASRLAASSQPPPGTSATRIAAPQAGADGGQRGVGQQAAERERHQQAGADRRGGAGAPRRQLVRVLQRVRRDGAAVVGDVGQRLGQRVGEVDQLAALVGVAGAACGRSPRTAPAAGRRAWSAAAGWTRPTRRSVAAGEPARIGLTPASAS